MHPPYLSYTVHYLFDKAAVTQQAKPRRQPSRIPRSLGPMRGAEPLVFFFPCNLVRATPCLKTITSTPLAVQLLFTVPLHLQSNCCLKFESLS